MTGIDECVWQWPGMQPWENVSDPCSPPAVCFPPEGDGLFIGQEKTTTCSVSDDSIKAG